MKCNAYFEKNLLCFITPFFVKLPVMNHNASLKKTSRYELNAYFAN